MFDRNHLPPQWWLRLLMPPLFFIGGALLVMWAQGWRFDLHDGELVSTGVISVTTSPPGASVFINGQPRGNSPDVFLGVPTGNVRVCLRQTGFHTFCEEIIVDQVHSHRYRNLQLIPETLVARPLGDFSSLLFDPWGRGYIRWYPDLQDAQIVDGGETRFFGAVEAADDYRVSANGELLSLIHGTLPGFVSDVPDATRGRFSPDGTGFLYFSGNGILYKNTQTQENLLFHRFDENIEQAFYLPESESVVAITHTGIYMFHRLGSPPVFLFRNDAESDARFYSAGELLIFQQDGEYFEFSFAGR